MTEDPTRLTIERASQMGGFIFSATLKSMKIKNADGYLGRMQMYSIHPINVYYTFSTSTQQGWVSDRTLLGQAFNRVH